MVPLFLWWFIETPLAMLVAWVLYTIFGQRRIKRAIAGVVLALGLLYLLPTWLNANNILFGVWVLYTLVMLLFLFFDWYLDAWLLTNNSVIDVKWEGFFRRSVKRLDYKGIENVSYAVSGLLATIFGYGTVKIEQAGGVTEIHSIANPKKVEALITQYRDALADSGAQQDEAGIKDILANIVKRHLAEQALTIEIQDEPEGEEPLMDTRDLT